MRYHFLKRRHQNRKQVVTVMAGGVPSDSTAPTCTITASAATITYAAFTATFTFSEDVTGFVVGDITVANGSAGTFSTVSASVYTAVITPTATGYVTVSVAQGACADAAANGNDASNVFTIMGVVSKLSWDFSDITTLFQDTGRTSAITADAQTIKGVTDKSGTANHGSNATGTTYKASIQNSLSVSRHNGSQTLSKTLVGSLARPYTLVLVLKPNNFNFQQYFVRNAGFNVLMRVETDATMLLGGGATITTAATTAAWQILSGVIDGASGAFYKNGSSIATGNTGTLSVADVLLAPNMSGDVGEFHIIQSFSVTGRAEFEAFLNNKWAIF
jgi:hypothetical protein